jgi:hypothetical protein
MSRKEKFRNPGRDRSSDAEAEASAALRATGLFSALKQPCSQPKSRKAIVSIDGCDVEEIEIPVEEIPDSKKRTA